MQEILQQLIEFDHRLFLNINQTWDFPGFAMFFPLWTNLHKTAFFIFGLVPTVFVLTYLKAGAKGSWVLVLALATASFGDLMSATVLKPLFARNRPLASSFPLEAILRGPNHGSFSFPSSHALASFWFALFVGTFYPGWRYPLIFLAAVTAYSRVYCGVHFPSDVLAGAIMGAAFGWGTAVVTGLVFKKRWQR